MCGSGNLKIGGRLVEQSTQCWRRCTLRLRFPGSAFFPLARSRRIGRRQSGRRDRRIGTLSGTGSAEPRAKSMTPACVGILLGVEAKSDEDVEGYTRYSIPGREQHTFDSTKAFDLRRVESGGSGPIVKRGSSHHDFTLAFAFQ